MTSIAKLSSKSQLTIPAWVRTKLGLAPGERVTLRVEDDRLILERIRKSIDELEGALKGVYGDVEEYIRESRRDRFPLDD